MPCTNVHRDAISRIGNLNDVKTALEDNNMPTWLIDDVTEIGNDAAAHQAFAFQMGLRYGVDTRFAASWATAGLTAEDLLPADDLLWFNRGQEIVEHIIAVNTAQIAGDADHKEYCQRCDRETRNGYCSDCEHECGDDCEDRKCRRLGCSVRGCEGGCEEDVYARPTTCAAPANPATIVPRVPAPPVKVESRVTASFDTLSETMPNDLIRVTVRINNNGPIVIENVPVHTLIATEVCDKYPVKGLYFAVARLTELGYIDAERLFRDADRVNEVMAYYTHVSAEIQGQADRFVQSLVAYSADVIKSQADLRSILAERPDLAGLTYDQAVTLTYGAPALAALKLLDELTFSFREIKSADTYGDSSITDATICRGRNTVTVRVTAGIHQPGIWKTGWFLLHSARNGNINDLSKLFNSDEIRVLANSGLTSIS